MRSSARSGTAASGRRFDLHVLLDAARSLFAERGYAGAQIADIASAAGTTKPTLYARLGNKLQIYLAVIHREAEDFKAQVAVAYERGGDLPLEELAEMGMEPLFRFAADRPEGFHLLFRGDDVDGRIVIIRREVMDGIIERLADLIRHRREQFGRHGGSPDELLAAACVGLARQVCERAIDGQGDLQEAWHLAARFAAAAIRELEVREPADEMTAGARATRFDRGDGGLRAR